MSEYQDQPREAISVYTMAECNQEGDEIGEELRNASQCLEALIARAVDVRALELEDGK
jgi:hypothetical protein